MAWITILVPVVFFIASCVLYMRTKALLSLVMATGFLLVVLVSILPLFFPQIIEVSMSGNVSTDDVMQRAKVLGLISGIGSILSALGFCAYSFTVKTGRNNE
jgi:hypothetical protein